MTKPGLSIESAASVIAREHITKYFEVFGPALMRDRITGQSVTAAYIDGLAGVMACVIASGAGSKDDVLNGTIAKLREALDRDLKFVGRK